MVRCNRWVIEVIMIVCDAGENSSKILQIFLVTYEKVETKPRSET